MLENAPPEDCDKFQLLSLTSEAKERLGSIFEQMEQDAKTTDGQFQSIRAFAARGTEQVSRVAGVLAAFGGHAEIDLATIENAFELVEYSLKTLCSLAGEKASAQEADQALKLYEWLLNRPGRTSDLCQISHIGPKPTRCAHYRDAALALLASLGLVVLDKRQVLARW
jgi:hypothetical protein